MKYPFANQKPVPRNIYAWIARVVHPNIGFDAAIKRVRQAIKDGKKAKKNPLAMGSGFNEKLFFEWAVIRWPKLREIEDIPLLLRSSIILSQKWSVDAYNMNDPNDRRAIASSLMRRNPPENGTSGNFDSDVAIAYVESETKRMALEKEIEILREKEREREKKAAEFRRYGKMGVAAKKR